MATNTPRLGLLQPVGSDPPSELRVSISSNATSLDTTVLVTEGTLASRPATGSVEHNHVYHATDTAQWFISDGTNWNTMLIEGAWTAIPLGTGVSNAAGYYPATARLVGDRIWLRGAVALANSNNGTIGTLPVGLRPASTVLIGCPLTANQPVNVQITSNGVMTATSVAGLGSVTLALDGENFSTS